MVQGGKENVKPVQKEKREVKNSLEGKMIGQNWSKRKEKDKVKPVQKEIKTN